MNNNLVVIDIETFHDIFYLGVYNPDNDEYYGFEISNYKNELDKLIGWYTGNTWDRSITYNGIGFDIPVIEYILDNYYIWDNKIGLEIAKIISNYAQKTIDNKNYGIVEYRENNFTKPTYDVFTILGLSNVVKSTSLKSAGIYLNMDSIEELPYPFDSRMSEKMCQELVDYCKNDLITTYKVYELVCGNTDKNAYTDNNQIELRKDISEQFGLDFTNLSDLHIGDELFKKKYADAIGKQVKELPKKGFFRKKVKFKNCIPKYIQFKTVYLKDFLKRIKTVELNINDTFSEILTINNRKYQLGIGGIHSIQYNEEYFSDEEYNIDDDDVSSYYPAILVNNKIYPFHLGKEFLHTYEEIYKERIALKPLAKTDKKIKGKVDAFKLSLNGNFGSLGSKDKWLYDLQALYSVTLTGQLSLLMLVEEYELNNINVISNNTDGLTSRYKKELKPLKDKIIKEWEIKTNFFIETESFKSFHYSTVNDYIAIKSDGSIKTKGHFLTNLQIYQNNSALIIQKSLQEFFINGILPQDYIPKQSNIFDFCLRVKVNKDYYLEEITESQEKINRKKLIRYFISNSGSIFKKIGQNKNEKNVNSYIHAMHELGYFPKVTYFNQKFDGPYDINYDFYIYKALDIISSVKKSSHLNDWLNSKKGINLLWS